MSKIFNRDIDLAGAKILNNGTVVIDATVSPATFAGDIQAAAGSIGVTEVSTAIKTFTQQINLATIATTGNTDGYALIERAGTLVGCYFSGVEALATSNTNYLTFSLTNGGNAGAKSDAMLSTGDDVTTKTTGGSALAAVTTRSLAVNGTALNVTVAANERLRFRAAATGTLANQITLPLVTLVFTAA